jgi:hypothetical protein
VIGEFHRQRSVDVDVFAVDLNRPGAFDQQLSAAQRDVSVAFENQDGATGLELDPISPQ